MSKDGFSLLALCELLPKHAVARDLLVQSVDLVLVSLLQCDFFDFPEKVHEAHSFGVAGHLQSCLCFIQRLQFLELRGHAVRLAQLVRIVNKFRITVSPKDCFGFLDLSLKFIAADR